MKGSEQIGFTILSLTVSLIAVLIPLLFMGDIIGRLFREFAVTLGVTILVQWQKPSVARIGATFSPSTLGKLPANSCSTQSGLRARSGLK